jgi:ABC-type uncharacterized transport system substrate-binding protein
MKRREFIRLVGGVVAWPLVSHAQQTERAPRVGFLGNSTAALETNLVGPFREGLREAGYEEGRNITIEYRWAEGKYERLPALVAELASSKVELIVTAGTPAALAVVKNAPSMPLVMVAVGDPVGTGLVASLARPGGNATGFTSLAPELEGKRLELLKEVVHTLSSISFLWNSSNAYMIATEKEVEAAAKTLGLKVLSLNVRNLAELDAAFTSIAKEKPDALNVLADRLFLHNRSRIINFCRKERLPGVHAYRELVVAGGLMSYGPSYADMHKRAAIYVDKILKGAKPADLPVQQPTKFEFVINLKTAKELGLAVPPAVLARADEAIE